MNRHALATHRSSAASFLNIANPRGFEIQTEVPGVVLREATGSAEESAQYLEMLKRSRESITKYFATVDSEHTTIAAVIRSFEERKAGTMTFLLYKDEVMVGKLHLVNPGAFPDLAFPDMQSLYLGGWTDVAARGNGVGPAVRRALAFFALNNNWCNSVYLQSHPENLLSQNCAQKAGFEFAGTTFGNGVAWQNYKFNPASTLRDTL